MNPLNLEWGTYSPGAVLAPAVDWLNRHCHAVFAFASRVIDGMLDGAEAGMLALPALGLMAVVTALAAVLLGWRLACFCAAALGFLLLANLWTAAMATLALVSVSVLIAVLVAFPLGVLASRSPRTEAVLRPLLDIMQTVPPWVYLIPAVIFFSTGRVPALIATIVYGIPPMLRLTTLAFKQVPRDLLELGQAIGASRLTILFKIEVPAARPTIPRSTST